MESKKNYKEWTRVKFFLHEVTNIRVTVSRLDLGDPMYRFSIGLVLERPAFGEAGKAGETVETFFPVITMQKRQDMQLGTFGFEFDYAKIVAGLVMEAQEWATADRARTFNEETEARYAKDVWAANRGKPVTKVTGKTARKKERLAARSGGMTKTLEHEGKKMVPPKDGSPIGNEVNKS